MINKINTKLSINKKFVKLNDIVKFKIIITNNSNNTQYINVLYDLLPGFKFIKHSIIINQQNKLLLDLKDLTNLKITKEILIIEFKVKIMSDLIPILGNLVNVSYNAYDDYKLVTSNLTYIYL